MLPVPPVDAVGVKVAVRLKLVPEIALKVPPVTETSPNVPSHTNEVPISSLNVKVTKLVSPVEMLASLKPMVTVGLFVSNATTKGVPAVPALPAASV